MVRSVKLPRENCYVCNVCHGLTVTVDVDEGVTPMFIRCKRIDSQYTEERVIRKQCNGTARSGLYPKAPRPSTIPAPKFEWYNPTTTELSKLDEETQDYVLKGGLLLRERTDREPVYHKGEYDDDLGCFFNEPSGASANEPCNSGNDVSAG